VAGIELWQSIQRWPSESYELTSEKSKRRMQMGFSAYFKKCNCYGNCMVSFPSPQGIHPALFLAHCIAVPGTTTSNHLRRQEMGSSSLLSMDDPCFHSFVQQKVKTDRKEKSSKRSPPTLIPPTSIPTLHVQKNTKVTILD
jgi:hypothetical protein